jgi:thiosulfate/3-mercaptopyruvate sulfurtransferase
VSVLDGGIARWVAEGRPLSTDAPAVRPVSFVARPAPGGTADKEAVRRLARDPGAVVLDARAPERYEGRSEPIDPRAGHIPGAVSAPFAANLREEEGEEGEEGPRFRSPRELGARYAALGATPGRRVVVYCGSGVTACQDLLALHLAGVPDALLYPGSWSDWSADPELPAATGPEPGTPP